MAIALTEMQQHLDECLTPERFQDYCPNGLQVEGRSRVVRLATGVTASQALIDEAIDWSADAILVHHGYFWRDESPLVIGMKRRRLGALLGNDISLLVYHLPLDAHPQLGNNVCFGRLMGVSEQQLLTGDSGDGLARIGSLPEAING
ncbi:MAG: Nif3-like dinuclear metal center protein, partial [Halieaceae bacterium]|nr:Nif3-like dinuclear metal center protein [Halieaceae bacterium]